MYNSICIRIYYFKIKKSNLFKTRVKHHIIFIVFHINIVKTTQFLQGVNMKTYKAVIFIDIILCITIMLSLALLVRVENNIRFIAIIYMIFVVNFAGAMGPKGTPGYILFKKTSFKLKKIIIFDFENWPNIPMRLLFHQLLSYIFLIIGMMVYLILYLISIYSSLNWDWDRVLIIYSTAYGFGLGGIMELGFMIFMIYEFKKYRGEFYVDSKIIK